MSIHSPYTGIYGTYLLFLDVGNFIKEDKINCLKFILKQQPEIVHLKDVNRYTLLYTCAITGNDEALSILLLSNSEHINDCNRYNYTALMCAAQNGHSTCVDILVKHGAELNIQNSINKTALMYAAENGHSTCVDILVNHSAELNIQCTLGGNTALMYAARKNNEDCVKILLQHNADAKVKNNDGKTAYNLTSSEEIKALLREHSN